MSGIQSEIKTVSSEIKGEIKKLDGEVKGEIRGIIHKTAVYAALAGGGVTLLLKILFDATYALIAY